MLLLRVKVKRVSLKLKENSKLLDICVFKVVFCVKPSTSPPFKFLSNILSLLRYISCIICHKVIVVFHLEYSVYIFLEKRDEIL